MRSWRVWLALAVWGLVVLIQWPLWFGKGGWLRVSKLEQRLEERAQLIERKKNANEALLAEVMSLREGKDAIEERARRELYMVRGNEVLFRVKGSPEEQAKLAADEARRAADEVKAEARALEKAKAEAAKDGEEKPDGEAPAGKQEAAAQGRNRP